VELERTRLVSENRRLREELRGRFRVENLVGAHGSMQEVFRIVHKVANGSVRERLVALNGAAREIIRTEREVLCYLPDENSVVVENRKADRKGFPTIMPERLAELGDYYRMMLGKRERIAGRYGHLDNGAAAALLIFAMD